MNDPQELLYQTCLETGSSGEDATESFHNFPDLLGDRCVCGVLLSNVLLFVNPPLLLHLRFVGPYLLLSADLSFVLEDEEGQCGYVLAALNSKDFYQRFRDEWLPTVLDKYPLTAKADKAPLTGEEVEMKENN